MSRSLLALLWLVLAGQVPGYAQQATQELHVNVLDVFLTFLVDLHAHIEACPSTSPPLPPTIEDDWVEARAILIGSLWASNVPGDIVRRIEAIFDGDLAEPDCANERMAHGIQLVGERGWTLAVKGALTDLGFTVVEKPASSDQWEEIKSVLAAERQLQARLFDCVAVQDPLNITSAASSWSMVLVETGQALVAAGLPRDEVVAEIDASDISRLWRFPKTADQRAELLAECEADTSWIDRFSQFGTYKIKTETMRILSIDR